MFDRLGYKDYSAVNLQMLGSEETYGPHAKQNVDGVSVKLVNKCFGKSVGARGRFLLCLPLFHFHRFSSTHLRGRAKKKENENEHMCLKKSHFLFACFCSSQVGNVDRYRDGECVCTEENIPPRCSYNSVSQTC